MATPVALQESTMNQILQCDWLPEQARWHYLAHLGLPAASTRKLFLFLNVLNPLLTKLVLPRWLDISLVHFLSPYRLQMYLCFIKMKKGF